ncbi:glutamate synthase small subunit, partial [Gammaproteobacteria bacterium]|nr:glutamate synthase small subunit [Gammaproteobacteria bacterium]
MNKNKQYKIEKGLLLFTQPRSPYFYGKFRINGKYRTKSFAPISNIADAKKRLYEWREEILEQESNFNASQNLITS